MVSHHPFFPTIAPFGFVALNNSPKSKAELSRADLAFFTPNQLAKFPPRYFERCRTISSVHEMRRDRSAIT